MGVVIIGAGHAGVETADALRREGYTGSIIVVDGANDEPYQRPPLSKDAMQSGPALEPLPLRNAGFWAEHGIDLRLGSAATSIDRANRQVELAGGTQLSYDHLVIAAGAHPRPIECPGLDLDGVLVLRTVADAHRVREKLSSSQCVVVVGAGFIGLEFASAAIVNGLQVTVLEQGNRPMQRVLSPTMSEYFRTLHEAAGTRLVFCDGLSALEGADGRVSAVIATSGERHAADLVVLGLGIMPADELAACAGLEVNNGIVVNEQLLTSDPNILAIGDCASYPDIAAGRYLRLESVQNATDHARTAAKTITGHHEPYREVPWFWTIQFGAKLQIAGLGTPTMHTVVIGDLKAGRGSVLGFEADQLVCVESVGAPADHMAARKLLAVSAALSPEDVLTKDFSLRDHLRRVVTRPV